MDPGILSGNLPNPVIVYGAVRPVITRVELIESDNTQSTNTIAAPRELAQDVSFFIFFVASSPENVVLDNDSEIPAVILRPEGHRFAYYFAWLPDAFASGDVRFASGARVLGTRELCGSRNRKRSDRSGDKQGFSCSGRVAGR